MRPTVDIAAFLAQVHPYDSLSADELSRVAQSFSVQSFDAGTRIYSYGDRLKGLYVVVSGVVDITDAKGAPVSQLGNRNSFGERGLGKDGFAVTTADARDDSLLLVLPPRDFHALIDQYQSFRRFFARGLTTEARKSDLNTSRVADLMARNPIFCAPGDSIRQAAEIMRDKHISSLAVLNQDALVGIITNTDLVDRVVAAGLDSARPVEDVMTANPVTLSPNAIGGDVLHAMMERGIGHLPVVDGDRLVGMVTQTDLTRFQAVSSAALVKEIANAANAEDMAAVTARIPQLLVQLVGAGNRHDIVTRLITNIADACTRRLLTLAEQKMGPAPVPWLWLACGSQGRQEQTGVSDQDNCLFLSDDATEKDLEWFREFAQFVSDGLHICGYVYCPGDMMATNPKWCQPVHVWRQYFQGWIDKPDPMAQMLSSVMYDLRPIGGDESLFDGLQKETLARTAENSIFVAHMLSNALNHTPPLGLLRGIATIRSGEHKNTLDMKHNGVVPVVDLARIYALQGQLLPVNTRQRLEAAREKGIISKSGGADLIAAYDMIADERLQHQAHQIKADVKPDNYLLPASLSDFQRSHMRDAFVVIRSMQSALSHGRAAPI